MYVYKLNYEQIVEIIQFDFENVTYYCNEFRLLKNKNKFPIGTLFILF